MKLEQKHLVKGIRKYELDEEGINVDIDMPFLKKEFTVVFSVLDPEPVVQGDCLAFVSVVNRETLLEFFIDKPDPASFREFVDTLKERVAAEEFGKPGIHAAERTVKLEQLQIAIDMLNTYLTGDEYKPLLDALEALKAEPESKVVLQQVFDTFNALGPGQGLVLTYAPYVSTLLTGDIPDFGAPE